MRASFVMGLLLMASVALNSCGRSGWSSTARAESASEAQTKDESPLGEFQNVFISALKTGASVTRLDEAEIPCPNGYAAEFCTKLAVGLSNGQNLLIESGGRYGQTVNKRNYYKFQLTQGRATEPVTASMCLRDALNAIEPDALKFKAVTQMFNDSTLVIFLQGMEGHIWADFSTGDCKHVVEN